MQKRRRDGDGESAVVNDRAAGLNKVRLHGEHRQERGVVRPRFQNSAVEVDDAGISGLRFGESTDGRVAAVEPQGGDGGGAGDVVEVEIVCPK